MRTTTLWQMTLLALEYLRGRKLRTMLTTLSIVFGVMLIFTINLVLPSARDAFKRVISTTSGTADLTISTVTSEAFSPATVLDKVKAVDGVRAVSGVLRRKITLPGTAGAGSLEAATQIELIGIDPTTAQSVRNMSISDGEMLKPGDTGKVILPATIAELMPQMKVGFTFPLITAGGLRFYQVVGLVADKNALTTPSIIMPLADAQAVFNQPELINTIEVAFQPNVDQSAVTGRVLETLGSNFTQYNASGADTIFYTLETSMIMFNVLGMFALFMGGFLIYNTFRTIVVERQRDLGMLRAIGAQRGQLTQMLLIEGAIQGVIGTAIGLLLGYVVAILSSVVMAKIAGQFIGGLTYSIVVTPQAVLLTAALGLITTLGAVYFPARAAGKASPLQALRPASIAAVQRAARWSLIAGLLLAVLALVIMFSSKQASPSGAMLFLIGMLLAAPALVLPAARLFSPLLSLWFAREGDLARSNLTRQPGRAAITASTLMIGLAVFIAIGAIVNSFDTFIVNLVTRNFASDIIIIPPSIGVYGSIIGADESLSQRIAALPSVQTVAGLRYASGSANGQPIQVLGINPETYPILSPFEFSDGTPEEAYAALASGRNAIINPNVAASLKVKVSDSLSLQTAEGVQSYHIVGIANEVLSMKIATVVISQDNLKSDFHRAEDVMLMVNLKPDTDKTSALGAIQTILKDYPQLSAKLTGEYRDFILTATVTGLKFFNFLAVLIVIPAALGLLNTLTINVLERTREIGMIRAVGGSRKQIRRMIMAEALLLGLFGTAIGIVAGIVLSYGFTAAISSAGFPLTYSFPILAMLVALITSIIMALLASLLPARNAAKMDIIRAIQYE
jgi:putative ABC transport system permease protein